MDQFPMKVQQEVQFHNYPRPRNKGGHVQDKKESCQQVNEPQQTQDVQD